MGDVAQLPCKIQAALDDQAFRQDVGADIHRRRVALNISVNTMAEMLCCSEKSLKMVEEGLLFLQMPKLRIECLILLQRIESRREGRREEDFRIV